MGIPHVRMISDLANSDASLWISVQDLRNEVLAVRREELGHLVNRSPPR